MAKRIGNVFERMVRNSVMAAKTQQEYYQSLAWLYGGNGLTQFAAK